jgi:ribonuclease Z
VSFKVTILGSGSAVPTSRRNPSAQLVECNSRYILIDCGEGTQMQIRKFGLKFQRIEYILISHMHGDHYFGLVGLLSTMHMFGRVKPLKIYGPSGLKEIAEIQLNNEGSKLAFELVFTSLETSVAGVVFEDAKIRVRHFPLSHKIPTNGFVIEEKPKERSLNIELAREDSVKIEYYHRLKQGEDVELEDGSILSFEKYTTKEKRPSSYAYCSDTKYYEPIIDHVKNVDVLYHEATFIEELQDRAKSTMHSTAKQAATIAKKADVKQLLMGHISARYDTGSEHIKEASQIFSNCKIVEDGDEFIID